MEEIELVEDENSEISDSDSDITSTTGDSTSSDDDELLLEEVGRPNVRTKNENYLEDIVPQYTEDVFIEHFRISRNSVNQISNLFTNSNYFKHYSGQFDKISAKDQVLIYLWYVGHQTVSFRDVADRFCITISTLHRVIRRLSYFLSNQSPNVIKWPDEVEKQEIEQHFRRNGFPHVIGVIDGTHIKLDKPRQDPDSYINRKGYYSMHVQLVCDHHRRIRDIFLGFPGSVHDSRVFRRSPLSNTLQEKCGNDLYILGDSGYPLLPNLLTPFRDRGQLTIRQRRYNTKLSQNRIIVEHCIGLWKQKFRQLFHLKLRSIRDIAHVIRACAVLHNISIDDNFIINELPHEPIEDENFMNEEAENEEEEDRNAVAIRNHVVNIL